MTIGCDCMNAAAVSMVLRGLIASVRWLSVACAKGCDLRPYFWQEIVGEEPTASRGRLIGSARS